MMEAAADVVEHPLVNFRPRRDHGVCCHCSVHPTESRYIPVYPTISRYFHRHACQPVLSSKHAKGHFVHVEGVELAASCWVPRVFNCRCATLPGVIRNALEQSRESVTRYWGEHLTRQMGFIIAIFVLTVALLISNHSLRGDVEVLTEALSQPERPLHHRGCSSVPRTRGDEPDYEVYSSAARACSPCVSASHPTGRYHPSCLTNRLAGRGGSYCCYVRRPDSPAPKWGRA